MYRVVIRNDVERRFTSFGLEVGHHSRSGSISFRNVHLAPNCGWILVFFLQRENCYLYDVFSPGILRI